MDKFQWRWVYAGLCLGQIQKSAGAPEIACSILPVPADNRRTPPHEQWLPSLTISITQDIRHGFQVLSFSWSF